VGTSSLEAEVSRYSWYHTLDLGDGVVTQGMFDHRPVLAHYPVPADLTGMRCLDVGTMDGFWAFEMERRGAEEVVAVDLEDPERLDWPRSLRATNEKTMDYEKPLRFALARDALGSSVNRVLRSVYELDQDLGTFDFIFCGDLLVHLKDPITAVENLRRVCRGSATVCTPITRFRLGRGRALADFDGIDNFQWWSLSQAALERMMRAAGFGRVQGGKPFEVRPTSGGVWRGLRGVARGYVDDAPDRPGPGT
jgi:tRNA (mo5U34)-methyltransferase